MGEPLYAEAVEIPPGGLGLTAYRALHFRSEWPCPRAHCQHPKSHHQLGDGFTYNLCDDCYREARGDYALRTLAYHLCE